MLLSVIVGVIVGVIIGVMVGLKFDHFPIDFQPFIQPFKAGLYI